MAFTPGTKLSSYEVSGLLGKGGMGEVYRALDTKLGREVAIKTLPSEFASDPDRVARLGREARLLATLNHPNVAGIYGLEESGEARFLVLELVDGETLGERIARHPLPVEQALRIALQIAAALEAAHANGVIHRDLKPGNIKIAPDGTVKVLDFGLAKACGPGATDINISHSPTLSMTATAQGVILGTAGYMSPEQARGEPADKQADIWAFGCILFEMLSGRQTWSGRSVTDIIAALMARDPDWTLLPVDLHPRLRFVLERCLEKETDNRYREIADVRVEIAKAVADRNRVATTPPAVRKRSAATIGLAVAGVVVTILGAGAAGWYFRAPEQRPVARFSEVLEGAPAAIPPLPLVAVSRDGTKWAVVVSGQIYLRNLGEAEARPVQGATNAVLFSPAFSPDGEWLAYVDYPGTGPTTAGAGAIRKIPVSGGSPQTIAPLTGVISNQTAVNVDVSWDDRNMITWVRPQGIMQVSANGGEPELIVRALDRETLASPQVLPDGKSILFTATTATGAGVWDAGQIVVQSIGAEDRTVIWRGGRDARYVPTGHLVYAQGTTLFGVPFEPGRRQVTGGQTPLVEGVPRVLPLTDTAQFAVSDAGILVYLTGGVPPVGASGNAPPPRTLAWVDRKGKETSLRLRADDYTTARISPNGTKAALVVGNPVGTERPSDIWVYDLATENARQLTFDPADDDGPVWTPGSDRLFFRSFRDGDEEHGGVYAVSADGGTPQKIAMSDQFPYALPWSLSPDGKTLVLVNARSVTEIDVARLDVEGGGTFSRLLNAPRIENEPVLAPNGQWMAYQEQTADGGEINIRPFPDVERQRFPVGPGMNPVFSRDGSELFFFDGKGISVVPVTYKPAFRIGPPQRVFQGQYWYGVSGPTGTLGRAWDVDPSGDRFLMIRMPNASTPAGDQQAPSAPPVRLNVVINWLEELKRIVPAR